MDFTINDNYNGKGQKFTYKFKKVYSRLTVKAKVILVFLTLIILYFIFQPFSSSVSTSTSVLESDSDSDLNTLTSEENNKISNNEYYTLSDVLHDSPKTKSINLSYLSLPPFVTSDNKIQNYKNGGNMLISQSADYIRLVKDAPNRNGNIFSNIPISSDDLSAFELEISFRIFGEQDKISLIGDGLAIWLTTNQLEQGDLFGVRKDFNGLGLFVDTYKNHNGRKNRNNFPYLSIQRNYGNPDFYDKSMDGMETQLGGCSVHKIYNNEGESKLRVNYVREAGIFEIDVDIEGTDDWKVAFRKENVGKEEILPLDKDLFLGVSAETGELHHSVDLYSIAFTSFRDIQGGIINEVDSLKEEKQKENNENMRDDRADTGLKRRKSRRTISRLKRQEKRLKQLDAEKYGTENGFVGWFFSWVWWGIKTTVYLILILIVCYCGIIAYRVLREKQKKKNSGGLL